MAGDVGAARLKAGDYCPVTRQRGGVVVGVGKHHVRQSRFKAVALGGVASAQAQRGDWHYGAAVQGNQAMGRAHKAHRGPAGQFAIALELVAHDLGDGQFGNSVTQGFLQALGQRGAAHGALKKQGFGLAVHGALEASHGRRIGAQGLQLFQQRGRGAAAGVQAHGHRHEFLRDGFVSRSGAHAAHMHRQTAGRGEVGHGGIGAGQALGLQAVSQHAGKGQSEFLQGLGRQFFYQQFNKQVLGGHVRVSCLYAAAAFWGICAIHSRGAMGKPRRSRLS